MNQFPVSPNYESFVLDRTGHSNARTFVESNGFLPQKIYAVPSPIDREAMAFSSRIDDLVNVRARAAT